MLKPFKASIVYDSNSVNWFMKQKGWDTNNTDKREIVEEAIYSVVVSDKGEIRSRIDDAILTIIDLESE